jgi:hypothetical protein
MRKFTQISSFTKISQIVLIYRYEKKTFIEMLIEMNLSFLEGAFSAQGFRYCPW